MIPCAYESLEKRSGRVLEAILGATCETALSGSGSRRLISEYLDFVLDRPSDACNYAITSLSIMLILLSARSGRP
ncbi:MAG: hypothetical protein LM600_04910 [Thaumarchaeota archaeon]|jgi:hypothetical protein|nr:hypothetical protein [Nitrososphaerota archaeon]